MGSADLLLAVLTLDQLLARSGKQLSPEFAAGNSAASLVRDHGADTGTLARLATESEPASISASVPMGADAEAVLAGALMDAGRRGHLSVGTVHLLTAMLDNADDPMCPVLRDIGVDTTNLRAALEAA